MQINFYREYYKKIHSKNWKQNLKFINFKKIIAFKKIIKITVSC